MAGAASPPDPQALSAGVRLLYHSFCTDVIKEGNRVTGIIVDGKRGLLRLDVIVAQAEQPLAPGASAKHQRHVKQRSTAKHLTHSS